MAAESTEGAVGSRVLVVRAQRDADEFWRYCRALG